ncbi:MAG: ribosome biogenesis GTPase YlqF [Clostridia bacterium]
MENNMNINWYPGHMAKTKRQIAEDLKLIDVVIEILDARIPISSRNPDIEALIQEKKKIIVCNKQDLADEKANEQWMRYYQKQQIPAVLTDANSGKGIQEVIRTIEKVTQEEKEKASQKGRIGKSIRVMVLGIPNVGKSSFINRITQKTTMAVGNRPGVTKQKQWVRINQNIELLDTPGVLWPKFQNNEVALHLAYTGTIKDDLLEKIEVAYYFLKFIIENHREVLTQRYQIELDTIEEIMDNKEAMENENIMQILYLIGKRRGAILAGGMIDEEKTANLLLEDFRSGKLGRITIEPCKEI